VAVAARRSTAFAIKADGTLWGWGANGENELANQTWTCSPTPVQVVGLDDALAVTTGYFNTFALKSDGTVWFWGTGMGAGGGPRHDESLVPSLWPDLSEVQAIRCGEFVNFALRSDGRVWAWGSSVGYGELGDGTAQEYRPDPVCLEELEGVIALGGGIYHTVALRHDGSLWAWGYNGEGELGDGTTIDRYRPIEVTGLTDVVAFSVGRSGYSTFVLTADGTIWGWGDNYYGQLGDGTTTNRSYPVRVVW
jgi:alpha-tubulin suppressor-like RCC1 family protein